MSESRSKTTLAQKSSTGSVAGATEVLVDHPLWGYQNTYAKWPAFLIESSYSLSRHRAKCE